MHSREVNTERARTKEERKAKKGSRSAKKRSAIAVASWHPRLLRNYRSEFVQVPPPLGLERQRMALAWDVFPQTLFFFFCSVKSNSCCGLTPQVVLMSTTAAGVRRRNTKALCKNL